MAFIKLTTYIQAPVDSCFDLAISVDVHQDSMKQHCEKAIAGITSGLMKTGDTVTWQAWHLGLPWMMKVKITELQFPDFFTDQMIWGPFRFMRHHHSFMPQGSGTIMKDEFIFRSPFGWLGKLVDRLFMKRYMTRLLLLRNETLKRSAEASASRIEKTLAS